jgi:hypothetical protein
MTLSSPYPLFVELRDHSQTLTGVLAFRTTSMSKDGETERVTGVPVSGTYFDVRGCSGRSGQRSQRKMTRYQGPADSAVQSSC